MNAYHTFSTRLALSFLGLFSLVVGGCSGDDKGERQRPPSLVETAPAKKEIVASELTMTGEATPSLVAEVSAQVKGNVVAFPLYEGAPVTEGETVLSIDCAEHRLAYREAKGRLARAEADAERARQGADRVARLLEREVVSTEEAENSELARDGAEADLALRKAEADRAKLAVDRCDVSAPFAGRIGARRTDVGRLVAVGDPLFQLVSLDPIEIVASAPEKHVASLAPGLAARIVFEALPDLPFEGKVTAVAPQADAASRTFLVRVAVDNADGMIRGGMVGRMTIPLSTPEERLVISRDGVIWQGAQAIVYTVDAEGNAAPIPVTLGAPFGTGVEASGPGLAEGTPVVVTGAEGLRPGAPVKVVNSGAPTAAE